MKLFTVDKDGKLIQYKEQSFAIDNKESDLEILLENNPECFFDDGKILIIGRQVPTNFGLWIDLLGLDRFGNTVVIELKRGKTPRETVSQLLEYASFIDNLDYEQLNQIYQNYVGEDSTLEAYHQEYFNFLESDKVSFNKLCKLMIVAQDISPSIKQTAEYLRRKGIDIYCLEFKYFLNRASERMIAIDFVVGEDTFIRTDTIKSSTQLPKVDEKRFFDSLDTIGKSVFKILFDFAKDNGLIFRWGSKGFSLNLMIDDGFVGLCYGYPPQSVYKQSIYTGFEEIRKKIANSDSIIDVFRAELDKMNKFIPAQSNLKWIIDRPINKEDVEAFCSILKIVINKINENEIIKPSR
jgi:RecB family endonuclease NucS